jgi:IclR family acetate operon transcriptional repressor
MRGPGGSVSSGEVGGRAGSGGVQSIERAFALLETMADAGGLVGLTRLAAASGLPLPTIHRLVRTLVSLGYVRQDSSRQYALGPRLIRLGEGAGRLIGLWARPQLTALVDALGESANLAVLDGSEVVYMAQVPGRHSMRMFTEVGRRVSPHCTAVGKALLARMGHDQVADVLSRTDLIAHTEYTITDPTSRLRRRRGRVRGRGALCGRRAGWRPGARRALRVRAHHSDDRRAGRAGGAASARGGRRPGRRARPGRPLGHDRLRTLARALDQREKTGRANRNGHHSVVLGARWLVVWVTMF